MNKLININHRGRMLLSMVTAALALSGCSTAQPFVGDRDHVYTPIEGYNYEHTAIPTFSVNGGCGPNVPPVTREKVGNSRVGGGKQCGGFLLPKKWTPDLTVKVTWRLDPYPRWTSRRMPGGGVVLNPKDMALKDLTFERHEAVVPVPEYGEGRPVCIITVNFLACNQVFVDLGCGDTDDAKVAQADFARFRESQKLCKPRPVINTIQDFERHRKSLGL